MNEILLALGVVLIFLSILVILFSFTVKRVNVLMKKIFVDKLQEYDYLIDDKEKKIDELDETIDKKTKSYAKLEREVDDLERTLESVEKVQKDQVVLPTDADFEDGNILSGYKKIKNGFRYSVEDKLKEFILQKDKSDSNYETYLKIRNYFNHSVVYKIMTYQIEEQRIIVKELLEDNEKELLKKSLNKRKFNVVEFINELDILLLKSNPEIKVYVGNNKDNYNNLDKNITTIYDDKITEGFKIIYKGVVYDYSI